MKKVIIVTALAVPLFLASCGDNKSASDSSDSQADVSVSQTPGSDDGISAENTFEVTGNDQMKFGLETIEVKAGEQVKIIFRNVGTVPKEAMGHNIVFLNKGVNVEAFAGKAASAKETDYIPTSEQSSILAYSKLLGPSESDTVIFTAPEAGEYDYICSFPGHYYNMKGKLISK